MGNYDVMMMAADIDEERRWTEDAIPSSIDVGGAERVVNKEEESIMW